MTNVEKELLDACVEYLMTVSGRKKIEDALMTMYKTGVSAGKIEGIAGKIKGIKEALEMRAK